MVSILAAVAYTIGPLPFGYYGLGDVAVFVFFGLIAVVGTYYVQALKVTPLAFLAAMPMGCLITGILVVNNIRDADPTARRASAPWPCCWAAAARIEYIALIVVAYAIHSFFGWGWTAPYRAPAAAHPAARHPAPSHGDRCPRPAAEPRAGWDGAVGRVVRGGVCGRADAVTKRSTPFMVTAQIEGTEAGIRASEQRYRHLFQHVPICIFVADLNVIPATIVEANRRAELVFGYTAAELAGMPAAELMPERGRTGRPDHCAAGSAGPTVTAEIANRHRDGTRFPVRVIATPDQADPGRIIVTVEDITAEKGSRSEAEAIDAERHRIAHEIHDGVAQTLAGLRFKSALWSHLADAAPPGMRAALDELQTVLNAAIVDLRRAIFALRPVDLDALGSSRRWPNL